MAIYFVQEDVVRVDEMTRRGSLLSAKEQVRRTVSDDNPLQHQQPPHQLPSLTTHHVSQAKPDFTLLSPVSAVHMHRVRATIDFNSA